MEYWIVEVNREYEETGEELQMKQRRSDIEEMYRELAALLLAQIKSTCQYSDEEVGKVNRLLGNEDVSSYADVFTVIYLFANKQQLRRTAPDAYWLLHQVADLIRRTLESCEGTPNEVVHEAKVQLENMLYLRSLCFEVLEAFRASSGDLADQYHSELHMCFWEEFYAMALKAERHLRAAATAHDESDPLWKAADELKAKLEGHKPAEYIDRVLRKAAQEAGVAIH